MIEVEGKALRAAMGMLTEVVERRNTIPILADVLVRVGPGAMTMITTDLDIMLEMQVDLGSTKAKPVSFCVDATTLKSIAAKLPKDGIATIAPDGNTGVTVSCGRSRFRLPTLPPEEFPLLAAPEWDCQFEMAAADMTQLIDSVRDAISTEETRYYLNGVFMHAVEEQLIAAATDGHRLAKYVMDVPDGAGGMPDIIVPRKAVGVIDALMDQAEGGKIDVAVNATKIRVAAGMATLTSKLIDGKFPDYNRVIPASNERALWFDPASLAQAVDRVVVVASEKTKAVKFDLAKDVVTLTVQSPENGTATEEVPADYDHEPMTIGFNSTYLLSILKHLHGDHAQALFGDPASPAMWRDGEDSRRTYVLMPLRV